MKQLKKWVAHHVLDQVYKMYTRPHLDYGDVVYHSANPNKFDTFEPKNISPILNKADSIQYEAAKIVTGAWHGSSATKLYQILGWESLNERRIMRKLCILHEVSLNKYPYYLSEIIESCHSTREASRSLEQLRLNNIVCKRTRYPKAFFPSTITDWNHLEFDIKNSKSKAIFKRKLLNKVRPKKLSYFGLFSNQKVKYLTMLRVGLSPLNAHKFEHNFKNITKHCLLCGCPEDTSHFLLDCKSYRLSRTAMFNEVSAILNRDVSTLPKRTVVSILLYGSEDITYEKNTKILNTVADFCIKSMRLDTL